MEDTTNWHPIYENEDQNEDNQTKDRESKEFQTDERDHNHLKSAEANGYSGSDDETSYKLTADDDDDDDEKNDDDEDEAGGSDWGTVDPQQDGRPSSNDPSGPGSAV